MKKVLITIAGNREGPELRARIANGTHRRLDVLELARALDADLIDYQEAERSYLLSRLLNRVGLKNVGLAWAAFRRRSRYPVIFTGGEDVGLLIALLLKYLAFFEPRPPRLLMIAHDIIAPKKHFFFERFRVQSHISYIFLFSELHREELMRRWQIPAAKLVFMNFMVDTRFFSLTAHGLKPPQRKTRPQACAVGIEARDYPTLMQAAEGLDLDIVIAASSPWSRQQDSSEGVTPPPNVQVNRDPSLDVRQLYVDSDFVIMPLFDVDRAAGSTTILEAMAMGKAVICSYATGQRSLVVDGETGIYVPPGDVPAMRKAIQYLLDNPAELQRMGTAGRLRAEQELSLDHYVDRAVYYVQSDMSGDQVVDRVAT
jgi:glycosyltransferase involved in cell wall biosynthesis